MDSCDYILSRQVEQSLSVQNGLLGHIHSDYQLYLWDRRWTLTHSLPLVFPTH